MVRAAWCTKNAATNTNGLSQVARARTVAANANSQRRLGAQELLLSTRRTGPTHARTFAHNANSQRQLGARELLTQRNGQSPALRARTFAASVKPETFVGQDCCNKRKWSGPSGAHEKRHSPRKQSETTWRARLLPQTQMAEPSCAHNDCRSKRNSQRQLAN